MYIKVANLQVFVGDTLEIEERVLVGVPFQHPAEEGGTGAEDHFMRLINALLVFP